MKRTQFKDALRNIGKQKASYLSIIVIALIGVMAFLGIDFSTKALRQNGSDFYNAHHFRDLEIVATNLLSQDDLTQIANAEGVSEVEGVLQVGGKIEVNGERKDLNVVSLTERINLPMLIEGSLPAKAAECCVEQRLTDLTGWKLGDKIVLQSSDGSNLPYLTQSEYLITGIVKHPDNINLDIPVTPYVLVTQQSFDQEALDGCVMKAEIRLAGMENANRFSDDYTDAASDAVRRLEELGKTQAPLRDEAFKQQMRDDLEPERQKLEDSREELAQSRADLDQGWLDLSEAEQTIADNEQTLADSEKTLNDTKEQLDEMEAQLSALAVYGQNTPQYLAASAQYAQGKQQYEEALAQYEDGLAELEDGKAELEENRQKLEDGEQEYADGLESLRDAEAELDDAAAQIEDLEAGRWLVSDGTGNGSFVQLQMGSENLDNVKGTFALLFLLVGALVIFATVSKMVDEQRTLVGTSKALGFFVREVMAKYLIFGMSATLLGTLLGILTTRFFMERFLLDSFNNFFVIDLAKPRMYWTPTLIAFAAGGLLSFAAVWFACTKLVRTPAVQLMQPSVPQGAKKSRKEKKSSLSLYSRLILLNMRTDLKRVLVTIVSIAGCCALVVIGITLRFSMNGSLTHQYGPITDYDMSVRFDSSVSEKAEEEIEQLLLSENTTYTKLYQCEITYRGVNTQAAELLCGDIAEICSLYHLNDWKTGEPIAPTDEGIYIQRRAAETCDLDVGSELEIALGGIKPATARIAGVFEHFIGRPIVMSPACYESLFGEPMEPNAFLVRWNGADAASLQNRLKQIEGFDRFVAADSDRSVFDSSTGAVFALVVLFIAVAAVMAFIVQLNLTSMLVIQKKRELTIMRVNGFTVKEVIGYLLRETVIVTISGILLGFAIGSVIVNKIIHSLEQPFLQFDRRICLPAWLIGAGLTVLFTAIVNWIALRPVKNLKLTDVQ